MLDIRDGITRCTMLDIADVNCIIDDICLKMIVYIAYFLKVNYVLLFNEFVLVKIII